MSDEWIIDERIGLVGCRFLKRTMIPRGVFSLWFLFIFANKNPANL